MSIIKSSMLRLSRREEVVEDKTKRLRKLPLVF